MSSTFNQGAPTVPTVLNTSNCFVYGNTASGNALSVQQLGAGNVFRFSNAAGSVMVMNSSGNIGVGTAIGPPLFAVDCQSPLSTASAPYTAQGYLVSQASNLFCNATSYGSGASYTGLKLTQGDYGSKSLILLAGGAYQTTNAIIQAKDILSSRNNGISLLLNPDGGNVGIGMTNPINPLHVYTLPASGNTYSQILLANTSSVNYTQVGSIGFAWGGDMPSFSIQSQSVNRDSGTGPYYDYGAQSDLRFVYKAYNTWPSGTITTATKEAMRISGTSGFVGIGTPNPSYQLDVNGGATRNYANADSLLVTECTNSTNFAYVQFRSNTSGTAAYTNLTLKNPANSSQFWICANNGTSTGVYLNQSATSWSSSSDARLKNIIEPISNAISKVEQINPCIYSFKSDETNMRRIGVIAQDVYKVLPEATDSTPDSEQMMGVSYTSLVPLALAAIKELSAENTALKSRLDSLEARLAAAGF
jgi:Chaperone of endosialidase